MRDRNSLHYKNIQRVIKSLALCHTVMVEYHNDKLIYNASSPDELALVSAANFFGTKFLGRNDSKDILLEM